MRYRKLHGTDLQLSELGFGTWTVTTGWWGNYTDADAQKLIRQAIDRGINYIDTADAYGNGRGETVLAPILAEHRDLVVGTKFGYDFYNNPERPRGQRELPQDMSPKFIRFALGFPGNRGIHVLRPDAESRDYTVVDRFADRNARQAFKAAPAYGEDAWSRQLDAAFSALFEREAETNLVVRAYHLFFQSTGLPPLPLRVHLEKHIPTQAGLGGGSSDAAAMLTALNHLSFARLNQTDLSAMAAKLGSDVPFFLEGGTALATGGYAVAILVYVLNRGRYHPLVRSALVTSALGYLIWGPS